MDSAPTYVAAIFPGNLHFFFIFNWVVCLPGVESCEFFIYFGDHNLVRGIIGKYVFPYGCFSFYFTSCYLFICLEVQLLLGVISFHFNAVFFNHAEAFYFHEGPFVYSFLYVPWFRGCVCEDVAAWNV